MIDMDEVYALCSILRETKLTIENSHLMQRLKEDLKDSYDEELELELE